MGDELPQYNPFNTVVCADCRYFLHLGEWDSEIDLCAHPDRTLIETRNRVTGLPEFVFRNDERYRFPWPSLGCEFWNEDGRCDHFEKRLPEHASDPEPRAKQVYDENHRRICENVSRQFKADRERSEKD